MIKSVLAAATVTSISRLLTRVYLLLTFAMFTFYHSLHHNLIVTLVNVHCGDLVFVAVIISFYQNDKDSESDHLS